MDRVLFLLATVIISAVASSWRTAGHIADYPVGGRALVYQTIHTPAEGEGDTYSVTAYESIARALCTGDGKAAMIPCHITGILPLVGSTLCGNRHTGYATTPLPRTSLTVLRRLNI